MRRTKISFLVAVLVAFTVTSCKKDHQVTDEQATTNWQNSDVPDVQLILNPAGIDYLGQDLPAFNLAQFKANYEAINIYEKFDIASEDLADLKLTDINDEISISKNSVYLPAGSVDGLAAAIAKAGFNGTVIVESGMHYESARVIVSQKVKIVGEDGAVIESSVSGFMPVVHVKNANQVRITGIEFQGVPTTNRWAILVENSTHTLIENNTILGYDLSVMIEHGNHTKVNQNTIAGSGVSHCVVNMNGDHVKILGNDISNGRFGAWLCDERGHYKYNTTDGNLIGVILCKVPAGFTLPDGGTTGAENSGADWKVKSNSSNNNILIGYLAIDGANNNMITNNNASGNGWYAIELAGDSYRFGFFTPASFENTVHAEDNMTVKDCGVDNVITGGIPIDTTADPCF